MKIRNAALGVSTLALAAFLFSNPANAATNEPAYNPATSVAVSGIVTAVHEVPAGQPLEGVHVTIKNKNASVEVYLGPRSFLKFLKTNVAVGDDIDVMGSRVKLGATDIVLAREVDDGRESVTLRDLYGAEAWKNWGVAADPSAVPTH